MFGNGLAVDRQSVHGLSRLSGRRRRCWANTMANSCAISLCCAAAHAPRRRTIFAALIATSFRREFGGNSQASVWRNKNSLATSMNSVRGFSCRSVRCLPPAACPLQFAILSNRNEQTEPPSILRRRPRPRASPIQPERRRRRILRGAMFRVKTVGARPSNLAIVPVPARCKRNRGRPFRFPAGAIPCGVAPMKLNRAGHFNFFVVPSFLLSNSISSRSPLPDIRRTSVLSKTSTLVDCWMRSAR